MSGAANERFVPLVPAVLDLMGDYLDRVACRVIPSLARLLLR